MTLDVLLVSRTEAIPVVPGLVCTIPCWQRHCLQHATPPQNLSHQLTLLLSVVCCKALQRPET